MTESQTASPIKTHILVHSSGGDITFDQTLLPKSDFKVSFFFQDGSPAVGILDVIHFNPTLKGKETSRIVWGESLEWGPSPTSPDDSWQKTVTVTNQSKSPQHVTIRLFTLNRPTPVIVYGESLEIDLNPSVDQTIMLSIKPNSNFVLYPNRAYNKQYTSFVVSVEPLATTTKSRVVGTISWTEEWHKFDNGGWARAIVFFNHTDNLQDFFATLRVTL